MSEAVAIRAGRSSDIEVCRALDAGYTSDYSWQVAQDRTPRSGLDEAAVTLKLVRLPRPRSVASALPGSQLSEGIEPELFLIAEDPAATGFVEAHAAGGVGWIDQIVVDRPRRRAGIATALLVAARQWAVYSGLQCLVAAVPARNHPGVAFFRARGFQICGYNERHFGRADIVLYLGHDITE